MKNSSFLEHYYNKMAEGETKMKNVNNFNNSFGTDQKPNEYELIADRLAMNATGLKFGEVSVTCVIHKGRIMKKTFSRTEQTLDSEK